MIVTITSTFVIILVESERIKVMFPIGKSGRQNILLIRLGYATITAKSHIV